MASDKDRTPGDTQGEARKLDFGEKVAVLCGALAVFAALAAVLG